MIPEGAGDWASSMTDKAERIAAKLRKIAIQVKAWEDRDLAEADATSRPAYFADLEEIADILEGRDARYRAIISPIRGFETTAVNVVRDLEIAEHMHEARQRPDYKYDDAMESAIERFAVSDKLIVKADAKFSDFLKAGVDREEPWAAAERTA